MSNSYNHNITQEYLYILYIYIILIKKKSAETRINHSSLLDFMYTI